MILALPEIVDDRASAFIIEQLQSLLRDSPDLTMAVLDALTSLRYVFTFRLLLVPRRWLCILHLSLLFWHSCDQKQLATTRTEVLETLGSYDAQQLPVVLRFILRTSTSLRLVKETVEWRLCPHTPAHIFVHAFLSIALTLPPPVFFTHRPQPPKRTAALSWQASGQTWLLTRSAPASLAVRSSHLMR